MLADPHAGAPLRVAQPVPDDAALETANDQIAQAKSAVTLGLYVSATRCLLQYVVAPVLGVLGVFVGGLGVLLQVLGCVTSIAGARRLRALGSRWWAAYAVLAVVVGIVTATVLVRTVMEVVG